MIYQSFLSGHPTEAEDDGEAAAGAGRGQPETQSLYRRRPRQRDGKQPSDTGEILDVQRVDQIFIGKIIYVELTL